MPCETSFGSRRVHNSTSPNSRPASTARAYLELVRLPNIFTAMADVAMGFLFVRAISGPRDGLVLGLLVTASSLLYAAGVVLGDLFDMQIDARQRPERPLPSGRVLPAVAAWLGWELLLIGVALAWVVAFFTGNLRPGVVAGLLAACIVLYDARLKRTPVGPVLMGACRMLNVLLGMSVAAAPWQVEHWLVAGGIGAYIVGVTWFARTETRQSSRVQLAAATTVMMAGIALLAWFPSWTDELVPSIRQQPGRWGLLMVILGVLIGWRCLRAVVEPAPRRVQTAVEQCILSLVILDAAVCYAMRGTLEAVMILWLLLPVMLLGRWIRLT